MRNIVAVIFVSVFALGVSPTAGHAQKLDPKDPEQTLTELLKAAKQKDNVESRVQAIMGLADFGPKAGPALPDLLDALQTKNEDLRLNAAITLSKIGLGAIKPVSKLLNSEDDDTRFYAIWTIGWIGPDAKETAPTIIKLMNDKNEGIRRKAAFALGRLAGDPDRTIEVLVNAFKDESGEVRQAAGEALARFGTAAVPSLIDLLKSEKNEARMQAATSLGEIGSDAKDAVPALKNLYLSKESPAPYHYAPILAKLGKAGLPALEAGFRDARPDLRQSASQAIQQMGAEGVPVLVDALGDKNVDVRRQAAQTLLPMRVGDKSVVIALAFALADEDDQVKQFSISALQQLGIQAKLAAPKVKDAMTDMNPNVRMQAYQFLSQIGEDPRPTLTKALESKNDKIRINTASLMVQVGLDTATAQPILVAALAHDDLALKMQAAFTLAQRKLERDKVLPIFVDGLKHKSSGVRLQAVQGVSMFGNGASAYAVDIAKMFKDSDSSVRQQSIYALQNVRGTPEAVIPILNGIFKDGAPEAKRAIMQMVYIYGDKSMDLIIDGLKDKDTSVRQQAIWAIRNVRGTPERMVPVLTDLFKDGDSSVKTSVLSIAFIYGEKSLDIVTTGLKDKDGNVRQQAIWALHNVRGTPEKMVPMLRTIFKEGDANARAAIIQVAHIYGVRGKELVMEGLKDKNTSVRQQAIYAISNIQGDLTELAPTIIDLLRDKDVGGLRHQLVWTLSRTGDAGVPQLAELLNDADLNVRVQASQVLRNLGPQKTVKALPALRDAIADTHPTIRGNAMWLVAYSGGDGPEFVAKRFHVEKDANARATILQTLVQTNKSKLALPLLVPAMKDDSVQLRQTAISLAGSFGQDSKEAFQVFLLGLKDSNAVVRNTAIQVGSYFGQKCHGPLAEALATARDSGQRQLILQSMQNSQYRSKSGVGALVECLKDANFNVRHMACNVLSNIGPDAAAALPALRELVNTEGNQAALQAARTAIDRIAVKN